MRKERNDTIVEDSRVELSQTRTVPRCTCGHELYAFFGCQWPKTPFIIIIKRKNNNDEHFLSVFPPNDYCNLEIYDIVHEKY